MKNIDIDDILAKVQQSMAGGRPTMPESVLRVAEATPDVDISGELEKRAAAYLSDALQEAHPTSPKLDQLGVTVYNPQDKHKLIMQSLSPQKRAALKDLAGKMNKIADQADAEGLSKQAADLRAVAAKIG